MYGHTIYPFSKRISHALYVSILSGRSVVSSPIISTLIMSHIPALRAISAIFTASSAVFAPAVFGKVMYLSKSTDSNGLGSDLSYKLMRHTAKVNAFVSLISTAFFCVSPSLNLPVPNIKREDNSKGPIFNILAASNEF